MRLALAVTLLLAVSATTARAQAPGVTPPSTFAPAPMPGAPVPSGTFVGPPLPAGAKDADTAILWSLGGTLGGFGLLYYGAVDDNATIGLLGTAAFFTGPSWGQWYAGRFVTPGLGLRAGGVVLGYAGLAALYSDTFDGSRNDGNGGLAGGLLIGGAALYVIGGVWDITTAGESARHWNERHTVGLVPTAIATAHGTASGLALTGTF